MSLLSYIASLFIVSLTNLYICLMLPIRPFSRSIQSDNTLPIHHEFIQSIRFDFDLSILTGPHQASPYNLATDSHQSIPTVHPYNIYAFTSDRICSFSRVPAGRVHTIQALIHRGPYTQSIHNIDTIHL